MADVFGLTKREYDAFIEIKSAFDGGKLTNRPERRRKETPQSRPPKGIAKRAQLQTTYQSSNGILTAKLLDTSGTEFGEEISVFAFTDQSTNDVDDYISSPTLASDTKILIVRANDGNWYLQVPALIKKSDITTVVDAATTSITVQTNYQIDGPNKKFQKKTRANVKVLGTDAESGWTDVHTGDDCP